MGFLLEDKRSIPITLSEIEGGKQVLELDSAKRTRMALEFQSWLLYTAESEGCECSSQLSPHISCSVCLLPKQYSVGEGLHRLSMGVSGVSAATTWQSGTSRGLHQGSQGPLVHLWFLAVITHFLYIAAAKLEICPQFLFILMKHRGVEIINLTVRASQNRQVDWKKKGFWSWHLECSHSHDFILFHLSFRTNVLNPRAHDQGKTCPLGFWM